MKILKFAFVLLLLMGLADTALAQKVYKPKADAKKEIKQALNQAQKEGKHVLVQVGGNWCPWCIKLHQFLNKNKDVRQILDQNYVFVLLNYSRENKNLDILKQYGYPQRFGFPVILVLNAKGERLHTQNTAFIEKGKAYDPKKVKSFLFNWRPAALDSQNYK